MLHNGLRDPEMFIAAGLAEGRLDLVRAGEGGAEAILAARARRGLDDSEAEARSSVNEISAEVGATRDSVRRWREDPAYELNRLNAAAFARFNAAGKNQK